MIEILLYLFAFIGFGCSGMWFINFVNRMEYYLIHKEYPLTEEQLKTLSCKQQIEFLEERVVSLSDQLAKVTNEKATLETRMLTMFGSLLKENV